MVFWVWYLSNLSWFSWNYLEHDLCYSYSWLKIYWRYWCANLMYTIHFAFYAHASLHSVRRNALLARRKFLVWKHLFDKKSISFCIIGFHIVTPLNFNDRIVFIYKLVKFEKLYWNWRNASIRLTRRDRVHRPLLVYSFLGFWVLDIARNPDLAWADSGVWALFDISRKMILAFN